MSLLLRHAATFVVSMLLITSELATAQPRNPDPPVKLGEERSTPEYYTATGQIKSQGVTDGTIVWREWWYTFDEPAARIIVGQGLFTFTVAGNRGWVADRALEDFYVRLSHSTNGCAHQSSRPDPSSSGIQWAVGLTVGPGGPGLGLQLSGAVGVDGVDIQQKSATGKRVAWTVDISDGSTTARTGVDNLLFIATWRCPVATGAQRPNPTTDSFLYLEIDDWGLDSEYKVKPRHSTYCPNPDFLGWKNWQGLSLSVPSSGGSCALEPPEGRMENATREPARVFAPPGAIRGGFLSGTVVDEGGQPVSHSSLRIETLSGVVLHTQTDRDGEFFVQVPSESDTVSISVPETQASVSIPVATTLAEMTSQGVQSPPSARPPEFIEVGAPIALNGVYASIAIERYASYAPEEIGRQYEEGVVTVPAPLAISASQGGDALTFFEVPQALGPGPSTVVTRNDLDVQSYEVVCFRLVSADLDQESLRSGEEAEFRYVFDFGPGDQRQVGITVDVTGPLAYAENGLPQVMEVGVDGIAELRGRVRAQQGTPTGTPFTIVPTLHNVR